MKQSNVPLELMNELYRCYDFFNGHFCKGSLPRPILLITQESKKKNVFGWFRPDSWNLQDKKVSEIVLHHSAFQNTNEVFDTLLHEMAHLKNYYENDCKEHIDCTEQQRHNKIFKDAAEFFGLQVFSSKRFGYGHTKLDENAKAAIKLLKPNLKLFALYAEMKKKEEKEKKESKLTPTMVGKETKEQITKLAEQLGISQKEVVGSAVNLLQQMPDRMSQLADEIFGKKFKTKEDLLKLITETFVALPQNQ